MKILMTVNTYKPSLNGVQFVTSYLAEGLAKKGHIVDLITCTCPSLTQVKEEIINGVHVIRWEAQTVHMKHIGDRVGYQEFVLEKQYEYDAIINVGSQTPFTDWLLPIMSQIEIPKVLHLHSVWDFRFYKTDFCSLKSILVKLYGNVHWKVYFAKYKKAFKKYDSVLQLHEHDYGCDFFRKKYRIKSIILENAVEESFFDIDERNKKKYVINVSNFKKVKNQIDCIKAFTQSGLDEEWKLVLVGSKETDYYHQLKEYCNQYLDGKQRLRVELKLGLTRKEICELVKESEIYLMTSIWEAFPISILESMAAGVPFVSSDVGIVKYLPGGIIAHSKVEFIKSLEKLAKDSKYRKALGGEGKAAAIENYRVEDKVAQLENILFDLIKGEKE